MSDDFSEDEVATDPPGASPLAERLTQLKRSSFNAAATREKLPQPLFWSLFHSAISDVRKRKNLRDKLKEILG